MEKAHQLQQSPKDNDEQQNAICSKSKRQNYYVQYVCAIKVCNYKRN